MFINACSSVVFSRFDGVCCGYTFSVWHVWTCMYLISSRYGAHSSTISAYHHYRMHPPSPIEVPVCFVANFDLEDAKASSGTICSSVPPHLSTAKEAEVRANHACAVGSLCEGPSIYICICGISTCYSNTLVTPPSRNQSQPADLSADDGSPSYCGYCHGRRGRSSATFSAREACRL